MATGTGMALDSIGALEARTTVSVDTASSKPQQGVQHADASSPTHSRQNDLSTGSFMLDELALPFCSLPEAFDAGKLLCPGHCDLDDGCEPPIVATKHPGTVARLHSDHLGSHMSRRFVLLSMQLTDRATSMTRYAAPNSTLQL